MTQEQREQAQSRPEARVKPEATILDATAGERSIWNTKDDPRILWIDIEPALDFTPDIIMDCTKTQFPDESISTIFFDPPHIWGDKPGENLYSLRNLKEQKRFYEKRNFKAIPWGRQPYYGSDKYQSKSELLLFIHKAQREFYRIIKKDGMLWVKWNETKLKMGKIVPFFKNWNLMLIFPISSPLQRLGDKQTYWLMFMKNHGPQDLELSSFTNISSKEDQN